MSCVLRMFRCVSRFPYRILAQDEELMISLITITFFRIRPLLRLDARTTTTTIIVTTTNGLDRAQ